MKTSWFIGLFMLFGVLTLINGIIEMSTLSEGEVGVLQALMSPPTVNFSNPIGAITGIMSIAWDYLSNLWDIFWFNYAQFQGQYLLIKYIFFIPISLGMIVSLVMMLRGVGSG